MPVKVLTIKGYDDIITLKNKGAYNTYYEILQHTGDTS